MIHTLIYTKDPRSNNIPQRTEHFMGLFRSLRAGVNKEKRGTIQWHLSVDILTKIFAITLVKVMIAGVQRPKGAILSTGLLEFVSLD